MPLAFLDHILPLLSGSHDRCWAPRRTSRNQTHHKYQNHPGCTPSQAAKSITRMRIYISLRTANCTWRNQLPGSTLCMHCEAESCCASRTRSRNCGLRGAEIKRKKPPFPYTLDQECGLLCLIVACNSVTVLSNNPEAGTLRNQAGLGVCFVSKHRLRRAQPAPT
eukprot:2537539-Rhodomonas_salina.2